MVDATTAAAWWAATVSTFVLLWDAYKWRFAGVRLRIRASQGMKVIHPPPGEPADKTYIAITVSNYGDRPTTITHLYGVQYSNLYERLFQKPREAILVPSPAFSERLPFVLEPGRDWLGGVHEDEELKTIIAKGHLYFEVLHSSGKRPLRVRINAKAT
jgi:hypothetical protein